VRRLNIDTAASIPDLQIIAQRRVPSFAFTYLDEGAGAGRGVLRNQQAFDPILLAPRRLRPAPASMATTVFGRTYNAPFGSAPVGLANLAWPGTDLAIARLAARENFPLVLSTAATTDLETIANAAGGVTWFQLYPARDVAVTDDLLRRAEAAGITVLVVTVDVPQSARRQRSIRQRVSVPFRFTPAVILDIAMRPRWAVSTLLAGSPQLRNFGPYMASTKVQYAGRMMAQFNKHGLEWSDVRHIRDRWKGKLVIKGIMDPRDAVDAAKAGADGVWVSNHGGRQLESLPATISALQAVRGALPREIAVFLDGGILSGESIAKALGYGADMVFCGRAFVYGAAAGGLTGVEKAFAILSQELRDTLTQIGCNSLADLAHHVVPDMRANVVSHSSASTER
jgi:isopentenyl diphosphate isomerase/L-lactate dehydrogenase-like FMN-dependent dehydrogenase